MLQSVFERFFIYGNVPVNAETGVYLPYFIFLSFAIASLGSFSGLQLASGIRNATTTIGKDRFHMAGAFVFGSGIWAMHFIGMLAYKMKMAVSYDPFVTFLSLIIAVAIAYGVLQITRSETLKASRIGIGGFFLGMAICGMHYTGMAAMQMDADLRYIPSLFFLSVFIAVVASSAALWIVFTLGKSDSQRKVFWQIVASLTMGAAICGMHYTGIAASVFLPHENCRYDPDQQYNFLALSVSVISGSIFATTIIMRIHQGKDDARKRTKDTKLKQDSRIGNLGRVIFIQLGALLSLLMILFMSSYLYVLRTQITKVDDGIIVSSAGLQRTFIQRFSDEIIRTVVARAGHDWKASALNEKDSERTKTLIEENFNSFLSGGYVALNADGERKLLIQPLRFEKARHAVNVAKMEWETLSHVSEELLHSRAKSDIDDRHYLALSKQTIRTVDAQDETVRLMEEEITREAKAVVLMQQVALVSSLSCFLITLAYARYRISLPVSIMYEELKDHRDNLEERVSRQTADLLKAKEDAERLNTQMQTYTDKLEVARLEQMDINAKLMRETETVGLLARITNAINDSNDVEQAIQICLNEVCAFTGWPIGHAYFLDESGEKLIPSNSWFLRDEIRLKEFRDMTEKTVFSRGEGIPGLVLEKNEYYWMEMFPNSEKFPRANLAKSIGIKAAMGFPVLIRKHVSAIIEFFVDEVREPEEELKQVILNVGTQLGRVIERENIRKAKREAEKANQAKSEFLANMSHELRTPLNSIIGLSRIIAEDSEEGSEEQDMNRTIHKAASSLLDIVNDILDLSKIEAGGMVLESIGFDLKEVLAGVLETLGPMASAKGLSLNCRYEGDISPYIKGDPVRVGRILTNLVGNAIKYTVSGCVDVVINYTLLESGRVLVSCDVKDSGIGIPEDKLDLIFQKFTQADETTTRKFGGTGLGVDSQSKCNVF